MNDQNYMKVALNLAREGRGWTSPNPMVGAVIVKNHQIIGKGFHECYGGYHAERNALISCMESPQGATLYVTLEPCCHDGKQPPCVDAILEAGIQRVIIGSRDPNPLVAGKGISILRQKGIEVTENVLLKECMQLNEIFFHFIKTRRPFVAMKYAMTMDGKIATDTGKSKWITGEIAQKDVHKKRHQYSAIMVGIGTILADDPLLTSRIENGKNPIRIICDTKLQISFSSQIVQTAKKIKTIIATCCLDKEKQNLYKKAGCFVLNVPECNGHLNLSILMEKLGMENIDSILLEGGAELNWGALESGIVQKIYAYIAPKVFGGKMAKTPVGGKGYWEVLDAVSLRNSKVIRLGEDFLMESEVCNHVYRNC